MDKKIALVTGANRGIGFEVVKELSKLGFTVFLGSRDKKKADDALKKFKIHDEKIIPIELDVTNEETIFNAKEIIAAKFNRLDVLVNNAGIFEKSDSDISRVELKTLRDTLETNTFGALRVTQIMLPLLLKSESGRIVNVSSGLGSISSMVAAHPSYNLSKLALNGITKMFAEQLRNKKILVNSVCPGWTNTDMGKGGRPVQESVKSVLWAVTLDDDGPTGGFFRDAKELDW